MNVIGTFCLKKKIISYAKKSTFFRLHYPKNAQKFLSVFPWLGKVVLKTTIPLKEKQQIKSASLLRESILDILMSDQYT